MYRQPGLPPSLAERLPGMMRRSSFLLTPSAQLISVHDENPRKAAHR